MVRSDRLSHPVALMECRGGLFALAVTPYRVAGEAGERDWMPGVTGSFAGYNGFLCSCERGSEIGFTLGYENAPALYLHNNDGYASGTAGLVTLPAGGSLEYTFYVFALPSVGTTGIQLILRDVYHLFHEPPRAGTDLRTTVRQIARGIASDSFLPEISNYATQLHLASEVTTHFAADRLYKTEGGIHYLAVPSISWTGGLQCAVPALMAGLRLGEDRWRRDAVACIDTIVRGCLNPANGLPYDGYEPKTGRWSARGWWTHYLPEPGHSAYVVGQAVYLVLKAAAFEQMHGATAHGEWFAFARSVLEKILKTQRDDGAFPYVFSEADGHGLDYEAFGGCWCLAAGALYARLTGDASLLPALRKAETFYHQAYVSRFECFGTPHDTDKGSDSEGVLAYVRAVRSLHELTGDSVLLCRLVDGLEYEFSYKFCYNSPIQVEPLKSLGWSSCGGTVTSTANPHIHPMSTSILDEYGYAERLTGDRYIRQRLDDTLAWSLQCHNRHAGEFGFGKEGWMTERFCHSEGLLLEQHPDGSPASVWFCYLPWAAGCVLEGLCGDSWAE
jgi:hypothetical protein